MTKLRHISLKIIECKIPIDNADVYLKSRTKKKLTYGILYLIILKKKKDLLDLVSSMLPHFYTCINFYMRSQNQQDQKKMQ